MSARVLLASAIAGTIALAAHAAHACYDDARRPKNVVSARVPASFAHGVALAYERFVPSEASLSFGLAARKGAGSDFDSTTITATGEARWWPLAPGPTGCREHQEMDGVYLGVRLDVGRTSERDVVANRSLGSAWTIATSTWLGWRFVAFDRVEITPAAATMVRSELGGGLAAYSSVTFAYDLTLGWMF